MPTLRLLEIPTERTAKFEGGFTVDHAGPTNFGVTQGAYNTFLLRKGEKSKPVQDISEDEVAQIQNYDYFKKPKIDLLPTKVGSVVFDYGYNSGPAKAIKALQSIIGAKPDGQIGPETLGKTNEYIKVNGESALIKSILDEREGFLDTLIQKNPDKYKKFEKGWKNRLNSLREEFDISEFNPFKVGEAEALGEKPIPELRLLQSGGRPITPEEEVAARKVSEKKWEARGVKPYIEQESPGVKFLMERLSWAVVAPYYAVARAVQDVAVPLIKGEGAEAAQASLLGQEPSRSFAEFLPDKFKEKHPVLTELAGVGIDLGLVFSPAVIKSLSPAELSSRTVNNFSEQALKNPKYGDYVMKRSQELNISPDEIHQTLLRKVSEVVKDMPYLKKLNVALGEGGFARMGKEAKADLISKGFTEKQLEKATPVAIQGIISRGLLPAQVSILKSGDLKVIGGEAPPTEVAPAKEVTPEIKPEGLRLLKGYKPKTLTGYINSRGGIDPAKLKAAGITIQEMKDAGLGHILKKGGQPIDTLAEEMMNSGMLQVPENLTPTNALFEALQGKETRKLPTEKSTAQIEKEHRAYLKELKTKKEAKILRKGLEEIEPEEEVTFEPKQLEQELENTPRITSEGPLFKAAIKAGAEWRTVSGEKMTTSKFLDKVKRTLGEGRYKVTGGEKADEILIEEIEPTTPLPAPTEKIRKEGIVRLTEELRGERLKTIANQLIKIADIAPRLITPKQIAYIHILKNKNLLTDNQYARLKKIFTGKRSLKVTTPTGRLKKEPMMKEEAADIVEALKGVVPPRGPHITGQPPKIPTSTALVVSDWQHPFKDLTTYQAAQLSGLDPIRAAELVDGSSNGPVRRYIVEPAREAERSSKHELKRTLDTLTKISKSMGSGSKPSELVFKYIENTLTPQEEKLITPEIRATAEYIKSKYNYLLDKINETRRLLKKIEIPRRTDYITHIRELNILDEFYQGFSNIPEEAINVPSFAKTNSPYFRFALQRLGGEFKEDAIDAFRTYADKAYSVIYHSPILKAVRPLVDRLPYNANKYFTQYLDETMAMRPVQVDKIIPKPLLKGMVWLRGKMGKGAIGPKYMASALLKAHRPEWRAFVEANSKMVQNRIFEIDFDPTILSKVDNALGFMLQWADREMVRVSWGAEFERQLDLGSTFEDAIRKADDMAFKTQSRFNKAEIPPAFRSKVGGTFLQFQNTVNNGYNFLRFDLGKNEGVKTKWSVFKAGLMWTGTLLSLNYMYRQMGIPSPIEDVTDLIPLTSLAEYGPPVALSLPTAIIQRIVAKTPQDQVKANKAIRRSIFLFLPAGNQVRKTLEGIYAVSRGGKFDKRGRLQFPIRGVPEQIRAITFGPYGTKAGRVYIRRGFKPEKKGTGLRLLR